MILFLDVKRAKVLYIRKLYIRKDCNMKRKITLLLLLVLSSSLLFSLPLSGFKEGKNYIPSGFSMGMGNDTFAIGGLSYNFDDQLSFSEHFSISAPAYEVKVNMLAFTNRGWREGWDIHDYSKKSDDGGHGDPLQGRYDVTEILLSLPLDINFSNRFLLYATLEGGVSIVGNQHYEILQNTLHTIKGISRVYVDYDSDTNVFYPTFNAMLGFGLPIVYLEKTILFGAVENESRNAFSFENSDTLNFSLRLTDGSRDILTASIGYTWAKTESDWLTQKLYRKYAYGPVLAMEINTGTVKLDYYTYLSSRYGFGTIAFDVLSFFNESKWNENNVFVDVGKVGMMNTQFYFIGLEFPITDMPLLITTETRYISGNPAFKTWIEETDDTLSTEPRFKRAYDSFFLGLKYEFSSQDSKGWVTPYSKIALGVMRWQKVALLNMMNFDEAKEVWGVLWDDELTGIHSTSSKRLLSFALDAEIGLTLIPEGTISSSTTTIQINIFGGVTMIHNPKAVEKHLDMETEDANKISTVMPKFGISMRFGFDV